MPEKKKVRYAVVGLGYIAQAAVLPAFKHAQRNSEVVALVSGDAVKLRKLGKNYGVARTYSYDRYEQCLRSGEVDAVYIALPNNMHREFTEKAAEAGVHVLCEKPMATTEQDCTAMIAAAQANRVKLMIAYRLHFEEGNLSTIELIQSGKLGDVRIFNSTFTQQVKGKKEIFAFAKKRAVARCTILESTASMPRVIFCAMSPKRWWLSLRKVRRSVSGKSRRASRRCCVSPMTNWLASRVVSGQVMSQRTK